MLIELPIEIVKKSDMKEADIIGSENVTVDSMLSNMVVNTDYICR